VFLYHAARGHLMPLPEYAGGGLAAAVWDGGDPALLLVVSDAGGWPRGLAGCPRGGRGASRLGSCWRCDAPKRWPCCARQGSTFDDVSGRASALQVPPRCTATSRPRCRGPG
jgi:hypothetical protein